MYCSKCGAQLEPSDKFCHECGASVKTSEPQAGASAGALDEPILSPGATPAAEKPKRKRKPTVTKMMKEGETVSPNVVLCEDGKYRWQYDLSLLKRPLVFIMVWKLFFFIFTGIFAVITIIDAFRGHFHIERVLSSLEFYGYFMIGMTVVVILGYLLYAAIMGGKYSVIFEMDDDGINHRQIPKQAKKARQLGMFTAMAGAAGGRISTVGMGLASTRTEMYTQFDRVRVMKVYRKRGLIKLNAGLEHNQVYFKDEDYDFINGYISERVPENARK